jgi:hypothetical protein
MRIKSDGSLDPWKDQPSAHQRPTRTPEERRAHLLNSILRNNPKLTREEAEEMLDLFG